MPTERSEPNPFIRIRIADARPPKRPLVFSKFADEIREGDSWYALAFKRRGSTGRAMYDAEILIRIANEDGRLVCTGLVLGASDGAEVTSRSLRNLPLSQLLSRLAKWPEVRGETGVFGAGFKRYVPKLSRGPKGLPDSHFERIAAIYKTALQQEPSRPIRYMRKVLRPHGGWPHDSTIHKWIQQCRELGLLGASIPGKAGEKPKEKSK